jgi:hypothetical protein
MNTDSSALNKSPQVSKHATQPIARLTSRLAALLLLAHRSAPRRHALPDTSPAAHSAAFNYSS